MKRDIEAFIRRCEICQQVKVEYRRPGGLLQPLPIPEWKWEHIAMDMVTNLPRTPRSHDTVWVIVDRLTKSAHFIPIRLDNSLTHLSGIYEREIVRLHGAPISIVSDRDPRYTSSLWQRMQDTLGTRIHLSTAYHPQTDGQSERVIQILEDMLRSCVLEFGEHWEEYLHLCEFSYNNSYQTSIGMAPFEALYGRPCRTPSCWAEVADTVAVGPEVVQNHSKKVRLIR